MDSTLSGACLTEKEGLTYFKVLTDRTLNADILFVFRLKTGYTHFIFFCPIL